LFSKRMDKVLILDFETITCIAVMSLAITIHVYIEHAVY
jgi:hypothetical protein